MTAKEEFIATVELIYSIYRDCRQSFKLALRFMENMQETMLKDSNARGENLTKEDLDKKNYHYGVKEKEDGRLKSVTVLTQGKWKEKIGEGGSNIRQIGNMCLVMIYQYWEDKYREEIANFKGIKKDELLSDLFGEIRFIRISIIHNNGQAIEEVNRCKILKWYKAKDEIIIDAEKMDSLIEYIKEEINLL